MSKRLTMQDVADLAGVSLSTVDRILNRRGTVKPLTVKQVLETAERIGFYGAPVIRDRFAEQSPACTFGFLLNPASRTLYREFAAKLVERTKAAVRVQGTPKVLHLDHLDEGLMVQGLHKLAEDCDVIAAVLFDTPAVHEALRVLSEQGCAVVAILTNVRSPACISFVGADPSKMGRGAGWIMRALDPSAGRILILSGSPNYSAHQTYVSGLWSFMAENSCQFWADTVLYTDEDDEKAEDLVRSALAQEDTKGIIVAGGGLEGVIRATERAQKFLKIIGTESSPYIDCSLSTGFVDAVISHPLADVVEHAVTAMEDFILSGRRFGRRDHVVPVEIRISETV